MSDGSSKYSPPRELEILIYVQAVSKMSRLEIKYVYRIDVHKAETDTDQN
jgi:hypothetical protein